MRIIDFLLDDEQPWSAYRTMVDLMGMEEKEDQVLEMKGKMLGHPMVQRLMDDMKAWPGEVVKSHKRAGLLYHKLSFIADLGITKDDVDVSGISENLKKHRSAEGLFQVPMNISSHFGGTGYDQWSWALCDAPLLVYSSIKMRITNADELETGLDYLVGLAFENGWPCRVSENLGKFRGPGKKNDPCPYATLLALKMLSILENRKQSKEARMGVESLLTLWEQSKERHPYMFFMGNDFRKLKAPFIWYDILHVVDVLSQYDFALTDPRFIEMLGLINAKADDSGLLTPESTWLAWKGWDFTQKIKPSPWLTFLVYRINQRAAERKDDLPKLLLDGH